MWYWARSCVQWRPATFLWSLGGFFQGNWLDSVSEGISLWLGTNEYQNKMRVHICRQAAMRIAKRQIDEREYFASLKISYTFMFAQAKKWERRRGARSPSISAQFLVGGAGAKAAVLNSRCFRPAGSTWIASSFHNSTFPQPKKHRSLASFLGRVTLLEQCTPTITHSRRKTPAATSFQGHCTLNSDIHTIRRQHITTPPLWPHNHLPLLLLCGIDRTTTNRHRRRLHQNRCRARQTSSWPSDSRYRKWQSSLHPWYTWCGTHGDRP